MNIVVGSTYFISDAFFEKIKDPFLKINYTETKRPHYFAFKDNCTELYWLVPCSSKVEKFKAIIEQKRFKHKPTDTIKIVKLQGRESVLLFQDMFPIAPKYIEEQYIRGGQPVLIADPKVIKELEKIAKRISNLLKKGICFTPTQPDVNFIENLMLEEFNNESIQEKNSIKDNSTGRVSMKDISCMIEKARNENKTESKSSIEMKRDRER